MTEQITVNPWQQGGNGGVRGIQPPGSQKWAYDLNQNSEYMDYQPHMFQVEHHILPQ